MENFTDTIDRQSIRRNTLFWRLNFKFSSTRWREIPHLTRSVECEYYKMMIYYRIPLDPRDDNFQIGLSRRRVDEHLKIQTPKCEISSDNLSVLRVERLFWKSKVDGCFAVKSNILESPVGRVVKKKKKMHTFRDTERLTAVGRPIRTA